MQSSLRKQTSNRMRRHSALLGLVWVVGLTMMVASASAYDFSAQATTGQTLYFSYLSATEVAVVSPADMSWTGFATPAGDLEIPASVQGYTVAQIDKMALSECTELTSVVVPGAVRTIGVRAFAMNTALTSVVMGEGVQDINMMAFSGCSQLSSIVLPTTLQRIAVSAFDGTAYYKDDSHWNEQFTLVLGTWVLRQGDKWTDSVVVAEGITGLANRAFAMCNAVPRVVLPSTLKYVGESAFVLCSQLDTVQIFAAVPPQAAADAFTGLSGLTLLVPCAAEQAYKQAAVWQTMTIVPFGCDSVHPHPVDPILPLDDSTFHPFIPPWVGIDQAEGTHVLVSATSEGALVQGAAGREVCLYDAVGRCLVRQRVATDQHVMPIARSGVYLLRVEGEPTRKVVYCK